MEEVVEKAITGDNEAFTELIISIQKELYKIAKMRLSSEDDISEAVQNTIIKIYNSLSSLRNPKYFKTWSIRILINECNLIYKMKSKDKYEEYSENLSCEDNSGNITKTIDELDFNILIKGLNYDERIAIILFYLEDLTTKEISKILNQSENTIRTRISRARNKLKIYIERKEENE